MAKLLIILILAGALVEGVSPPAQPPLLIDAPQSPPPLDAAE